MQKRMKLLHNNENGFTLVELMVVVVIIGVLVAISIPVYVNVISRVQTQACAANLRIIDGQISVWQMAVSGRENETPANNDETFLAFFDNNKLPICPNGGEYLLNGLGRSTCSVEGH